MAPYVRAKFANEIKDVNGGRRLGRLIEPQKPSRVVRQDFSFVSGVQCQRSDLFRGMSQARR